MVYKLNKILLKIKSIVGMNGDTMNGVNESSWEESLLHDYPIAIEPEILFNNNDQHNIGYYLSYNVMSWNYWTLSYDDIDINPTVPLVSSYKAMTNGKHLGRY